MADGWSEQSGIAHGGYPHWESQVAPPPEEGVEPFLPLFVRLQPKGSYAPVIEALLKDDATPTLIDAHEREWLRMVLARERAGAPLPAEIRAVLHRPAAALEHEAYQILHVAPAIEVRRPERFRGSGPAADPVVRPAPDMPPGPPVVAVIDDAIPYLNARFRRSVGETRFHAVWLQAREDLAGRDGSADEPAQFRAGRVLERAAIDAMIAEGEEAAVYARQNAELFPPTILRSSNLAQSHGGHVLDLAAGDSPGGRLSGVELLAVQLPPQGIKDTSGRLLDGAVVQGLRWVIDRALALAAERGSPVPLIVNLSIGTVAGAKDGSGFVEDWLRAEAERYRVLSGGAPLRLVLAYGNAYRGRQVALVELEAGAEQVLEWRLPPDDWTASYLELRAEGAAELAVEPPGGSCSPFGWPAKGKCLLWRQGAAPLAAIYGQRKGGVLVAVRSTHSPTDAPIAPAGAWRVKLRSQTGARVGVQVQRDETPGGYRQAGRQSRLAAPGDGGWDAETADWTGPGTGPLRRDGTHTSYAGPDVAGIYRVGASVGDPRAGRASRYSASGSAEGLLSHSAGPTLAAVGDDGFLLGGTLATGTCSGATARYSGTSAAAPKVTRALLERALAGGLPALSPGDTAGWRAEVAALLAREAADLPDPPDPRLGAGILTPGAEARPEA